MVLGIVVVGSALSLTQEPQGKIFFPGGMRDDHMCRVITYDMFHLTSSVP